MKRPSRRFETSRKRVRKRGLASDARRMPRWRFNILKQVVPLTVSTLCRREISSRCFCHPLSFACLALALPGCRVACLMCQNGDQLMAMLTLWMDGTLHFGEYVISLQNRKKKPEYTSPWRFILLGNFVVYRCGSYTDDKTKRLLHLECFLYKLIWFVFITN